MNTIKKWLIIVAALALLFGAAQAASAQTQGTKDDLDETLQNLDQAAEGDPAAILAKLAEKFGVDQAALQAYYDAGATPGELWLALEISATTATPLADAIVLAKGAEGHGWGVLAQVLSVKPGSDEFFALKGKIVERGGMLGKEVREGKEDRGENPGNKGGQGKGGK
ncbi:hypothetical protein LWX53_02925 [bacterium]|nr:hypothetical protein [bacterium]